MSKFGCGKVKSMRGTERVSRGQPPSHTYIPTSSLESLEKLRHVGTTNR